MRRTTGGGKCHRAAESPKRAKYDNRPRLTLFAVAPPEHDILHIPVLGHQCVLRSVIGGQQGGVGREEFGCRVETRSRGLSRRSPVLALELKNHSN